MRLGSAVYALILLPLVASGCAETEFVIHGAKEIAGTGDPAADTGKYKVGNPYRIYSTWYYPAEDYDYVETGVASWYGPQFHGKPTANGETFDMNDLTAAHRTLPMPSVVRVVNLQNGRSLRLRINDRGPFARGRIIDVSRRAAQLLGFRQQGTARVRVEIVADESQRLKYIALHGKEPPDGSAKSVKVASTGAPRSSTSETATESIVAGGTIGRGMMRRTASTAATSRPGEIPASADLFIQAGAYADPANAAEVKARLARFGGAQVMEVVIDGRRLYRVRLGPIGTVKRADVVLARVMDAGFPNARIIVE